jgi:hypothetical protein
VKDEEMVLTSTSECKDDGEGKKEVHFKENKSLPEDNEGI